MFPRLQMGRQELICSPPRQYLRFIRSILPWHFSPMSRRRLRRKLMPWWGPIGFLRLMTANTCRTSMLSLKKFFVGMLWLPLVSHLKVVSKSKRLDFAISAAPHVAMKDDIHEGYLIPKGSVIIPNVWSVRLRGRKGFQVDVYALRSLGKCCTIRRCTRTQWLSNPSVLLPQKGISLKTTPANFVLDLADGLSMFPLTSRRLWNLIHDTFVGSAQVSRPFLPVILRMSDFFNFQVNTSLISRSGSDVWCH